MPISWLDLPRASEADIRDRADTPTHLAGPRIGENARATYAASSYRDRNEAQELRDH